MTAVPKEGEYEVNNESMSDDENNNENENNSTYDENKSVGETKEEIENEEDIELIEFLEKHDLMDMKNKILSSKLKLSHFKEVEKSDLEDLCGDLHLNSSQKIRLKHSIKSLQRKIIRNGIKNKMKSKVLKSKNKMIDLKNKRLIQRKSNKNIPKISNISNVNEFKNDQQNDDDDDNIRKLRSKIVIVGEAAVGKTTLQKAMMGYDFEDGSKATFAVSSSHHKSQFEYERFTVNQDYEIFDTPGLDRFCDIITLYLRGALAVIVVYDVCNIKSFNKGKWWIDYLENNASGYDKIILIANKIDIKHKIQNESESDDEDDDDDDDDDDNTTSGGDDAKYDIIKEGRLYATEHGIAFLEISAKNKENVNVLLSWINKQSQKKIEQNPSMIEKQEQSIQLHSSLLNGNAMKNGKLFGKFDKFDFDYSKCCAF